MTSPPPLTLMPSVPPLTGSGISALRYAHCSNLTANLSEVSFCRNISAPLAAEPPEPDLILMENIVSIVVPILFGLIVILGLFGNSLVVIVVAANQQMRSTTNLLIINLAMADLLFIIFCVPFTATDYILPFWPFGDLWCKMVQYLIVVTAYASVYTLVLMSLDRFLAVVHPIASMSVRTERNAISAILVTWIVIIVSCVPVFLCHGEVTYVYSSTQHTACLFLDMDPAYRPDGFNRPAYQLDRYDDGYITLNKFLHHAKQLYERTQLNEENAEEISFFTTAYVVPLTLICGLYLVMLVRLWGGTAPGGKCSAESRRGKRRVTRMVLVVVAIFAICWCPIQVILLLKSIDRYEITNTSVMVQIISHVLAYMNSCVNPILYAFLSENFRKAFRKVIYCGPEGGMAHPGQANGRHDQEKSALTKTTRSNDIL